MRFRPLPSVFAFGLAVGVLLPAEVPAQAPPKRPVKHSDYGTWNAATGHTLSPDGKYLAYTFTPGSGDGAVVVRNIPTGAEHRIPSGGKSATAANETPELPAGEPPATPPVGGFVAGASGGYRFTPDGKRLVFNLAPPRSAVDKAKADKKKPEEAPRTVVAVMDLATGQVTDRIEKTKSFTVVGDGAGYLVYHRESKPEEAAKEKEKEVAPDPKKKIEPVKDPKKAEEEKGDDQPPTGGKRPFPGRGQGSPGTPGTAPPPRLAAGSDLVVRNLADGTESTFADVSSFSVTRDAKLLVYTVATKAGDKNGIYVAELGSGTGSPVKSGPGRYTGLTWDEKQTKFAFFHADAPPAPADGKGSSTPAPPAPPARPRVYVWDRSAKSTVAVNPVLAAVSALAYPAAAKVAPAVETVGPSPAGLKDGWVVVDRGGVSFSADGTKLYLSTAPAARAEVPPTPEAAANQPGAAVAGAAGRLGAARSDPTKVDLDIWHWKDDLIQPMQKVRGPAERAKTYRAAYLLDAKQFRQLSDDAVDVIAPSHGDWGLASTSEKYRGQYWISPSLPRDIALFNVRTGEGKPVLEAMRSPPYPSPKGKFVAVFDGKDWHSISVPDGKKVNLTGKLPVKFLNEDDDHPDTPPAYGPALWTPDERHLVLADKYDLWKVAADGSGAENLTKLGRGQKTRLRVVPLPPEGDEPADPGLDLSKPLLLSAVNLDTFDTGFYRQEPGKSPKLLVMGARKYGGGFGPAVTKAKKADVYLFTVSTAADYPDYYVADTEFKEVKRVTDVNPKVKEFNWAKDELVSFKSADGVPLKGRLIKPEDFDPAKKYPMIVYIYERLSQGMHSFTLPNAGTSINPTYYASNGYLVFMPDIVYTTGSPGQCAIKCVLPAIQAVCDQGFVNEDAIGIQGHSWGGYQIAYMVTQTNRFKAAAAGAPVSNMTSAYSGIRWQTGLPRQFQYERSQSRIGATLWEAPMKYVENSPVFYADRVKTPLLMLHNDEDGAVPWYQGIEYYLALRRLGKEVYMLNYNGQGHGLTKPAAMKDYTLRMQQFFDHHLKGAPMPEWMAKGVPYTERDKEKEQWKKVFEPEKK